MTKSTECAIEHRQGCPLLNLRFNSSRYTMKLLINSTIKRKSLKAVTRAHASPHASR